MDKPGPDREVTEEAVLDVFGSLEDPCTPLTASEVADELECSRRTALRRLKNLEEKNKVNRKKTGARSLVWWLAEEQR